jgi:hypothetical protein
LRWAPGSCNPYIDAKGSMVADSSTNSKCSKVGVGVRAEPPTLFHLFLFSYIALHFDLALEHFVLGTGGMDIMGRNRFTGLAPMV